MSMEGTVRAPVAGRVIRLAVTALLAIAGVTALYWIAVGAAESPNSMYAGQSDWILATVLATTGIVLLVGCAASVVLPENVAGILIAGLGITWLIPEVAGWVGTLAGVRSLGRPAGAMFVPLLVHVGLTYPSARTRDPIDWRIVRFGYGIGVTVSFALILWYDPFLDLDCWRTCSADVFGLLASPTSTRILSAGEAWMVLALGSTLVARLSLRLSRSIQDTVRSSWLVPLTVVFLAGVQIWIAISKLTNPESPLDAADLLLFAGSGWLLVALAIGVAGDLVRAVRRRRSLAMLASVLEAGMDRSLASILADALRDNTVRVEYWIPSLQRYVDASGLPLAPTPIDRASKVTIERSGEQLGRIVHKSQLGVADLQQAFGSAARLAVDNERLRAELFAQASEIRASQERIVHTADVARRRLERDLHDGAQQRLLILMYQLRLAQAEATDIGDEQMVAKLQGALDELTAAIDDVREVAHGIFPSILVDAGLVRALESVRVKSSVPLRIDVPDVRFPDIVELAVYQLAASAIAAASAACPCQVKVIQMDEHLEVEIERFGVKSDSYLLLNAFDRIGALGGTVEFVDTRVRAVIPCG
jgi:signal transduction histidine kinase